MKTVLRVCSILSVTAGVAAADVEPLIVQKRDLSAGALPAQPEFPRTTTLE